MKKYTSFALALVLTAALFTGCGCTNRNTAPTTMPGVLPTTEATRATTETTRAATVPTTTATTPSTTETTGRGTDGLDNTTGVTGETNPTSETAQGRTRGGLNNGPR